MNVNLFAILVGFGASLGMLRVVQNAPREQSSHLGDAGLLVLVGSLAGSRLVFCLYHLSYYQKHPGEVFQLTQGGLTWEGAALGGLIVSGVLSVVWRSSFPVFLDGLAPLVPPLAVTAWLGCWQVGVAYAAPAPADAWWGVPAPDDVGVVLPRFPLQFLAALMLLLYFLLLEIIIRDWKKPGKRSGLILLGLAINQLLCSFIRVDSALLWAGLRIETWAALALALFSLALLGLGHLENELPGG